LGDESFKAGKLCNNSIDALVEQGRHILWATKGGASEGQPLLKPHTVDQCIYCQDRREYLNRCCRARDRPMAAIAASGEPTTW
jgi:hypothetical protein